MELDYLQQIGLTKEEAQVFLVLSDLSEATASEICNITKIPSSRIYYILESLERLGVIFIQDSSPKIYKLLHSDEIFNNLRTLLTAKYDQKIFLLDKLADQYSAAQSELTPHIADIQISDDKFVLNGVKKLIDEAIYSIKLKEVYKDIHDKFRNVFDESPIGLGLYNSDGSLMEVNQAWCNIFGVQSFEDRKIYDLNKEPGMSDMNFKKLKRGERVEYDTTIDFDEIQTLGTFITSKSGITSLKYTITPLIIELEAVLNGYLVQIQDLLNPEEDKKFDDILRLKQINEVLYKWLRKLNCPACTTEMIISKKTEIDIVFNEIVQLLKMECQEPEFAGVKIQIDDNEYFTDNFVKAEWKSVAPIVVKRERRGIIEIVYRKAWNFTNEEIELINTVARLLRDFLILQEKISGLYDTQSGKIMNQ